MATYVRRRYRHDSIAANIISGIGAVIAVIIVAHVLFVLFGANAGNTLVTFVREWASVLALWFHDLFNTGNATMNLIVNYGLAIVFWLVVTGFIARLVARRY
jgi:hypothetical protein